MLKRAASARPAHILQVAYYPSLMTTREILLGKSGYRVTSMLGNDGVMRLPAGDMSSFDLVVVGFSCAYPERLAMVRWLKQNFPQIPVIVLKANSSEKFREADHAALSETEDWLEAVARSLQSE